MTRERSDVLEVERRVVVGKQVSGKIMMSLSGGGTTSSHGDQALAISQDALGGLEFAHKQAGVLLDAMTRAIHRSNSTMSAGSSANTTPQKYETSYYASHHHQDLMMDSTFDEGRGNVRKLVRAFDGGDGAAGLLRERERDNVVVVGVGGGGGGGGSHYLQYHQSRSPFGRRRDAADEREALIGIRAKLEDLQQILENALLSVGAFGGHHSAVASESLESHMRKIESARDDLLHLALRKIDVVVRERTILEAVIGFTRTGSIELEDGMDDLEHPIRLAEEEEDVSREEVASLIQDASSVIWRSHSDDPSIGQAAAAAGAAGAGGAGGANNNNNTFEAGSFLVSDSDVASPMQSPAQSPVRPSPSQSSLPSKRSFSPLASGAATAQQARRRIFPPKDMYGHRMEYSKEPVMQKKSSPVSVLDFDRFDELDDKLKIDGALPPSTVCGFPPKDSPIHPSKLSGDTTKVGTEAQREDADAAAKAEASEGQTAGETERRRRPNIVTRSGSLVKGVLKGVFGLTFKCILVVAAVSTVSTQLPHLPASLQESGNFVSKHAARISKVCQKQAKNVSAACRKRIQSTAEARRRRRRSAVGGGLNQSSVATQLPMLKVSERSLDLPRAVYSKG